MSAWTTSRFHNSQFHCTVPLHNSQFHNSRAAGAIRLLSDLGIMASGQVGKRFVRAVSRRQFGAVAPLRRDKLVYFEFRSRQKSWPAFICGKQRCSACRLLALPEHLRRHASRAHLRPAATVQMPAAIRVSAARRVERWTVWRMADVRSMAVDAPVRRAWSFADDIRHGGCKRASSMQTGMMYANKRGRCKRGRCRRGRCKQGGRLTAAF